MLNKYCVVILGIGFLSLHAIAKADTCPDPQASSLAWGKIPESWIENPYSPNSVQAEEGTQFVSANILVAGLGRGVICSYRISVGEYSIWWPVLTKIPARSDYSWIETLGGFICTEGLDLCQFYVK